MGLPSNSSERLPTRINKTMPAKKTAPEKAASKASKKAAQKPLRAASKPSSAKKEPVAVEADPVPVPAAKPAEVKLTAAKGRPMLQWVGKKPLSRVLAFPAQLAETFDPTGELNTPKGASNAGNLYYGDNKEVLAHLLANGYRGKVDLIYIDPPFDSGADYVRKVTLRGKSALAKLEGESYSLGEQVQYTDIWANDNYLQFMYERLILLKELLADSGAIWLHCDWHKVHHLRCLIDEVFGADNFRNEVVWSYPGREMHIEQKFNAKHDTLLFAAKSEEHKINMKAVALEYDRDERLKGLRRKVHKDEDGKEWVWETRGQASGQEPYKRYVDEIVGNGRALNDVWDDVQFLRGNDPVRTGYATQKPEELVERIVLACTGERGLVLDCFIGSGTAIAVAQKLGRRWIGCDINKGAIQTASKRLQGIITEQLADAEAAATTTEGDLFGAEEASSEKAAPAALSFKVQRVNDYDLAVQHNEAVALACEHIGVQRTKTDAYFDGIQGKRLVKIIPFNHPLSPIDLQQLKQELAAREKEERDILLVCLGKELACEAWLAEWGRLRKRGDVPNKIEVIELRTDPKYGKFMTHTPASAKVGVQRKGAELLVTIEDFASPTIIERLDSQDSRLFKAHVTDWRFMVDCVMIDPAYNGSSFNIALTDLPEKKTDLVNGSYTLAAPEGKTTVAVKIVDMLGEEVLIMAEV